MDVEGKGLHIKAGNILKTTAELRTVVKRYNLLCQCYIQLKRWQSAVGF